MRKNVKRWLIAIAVYAVLFWAVPFATGPGDAWTRILIAHTLLVVVGLVSALSVMAFGKPVMALVTWLKKRLER